MRQGRYTQILPIIWRQKSALLVILILSAVTAVFAALMPWPLKILVDYGLGDLDQSKYTNTVLSSLLSNAGPTTFIFIAGLSSFSLFILSSVVDFSTTWLWSKTGRRMVYDLASVLFQRLQRLSMLFHSTHHVGDSLARLTVDSWCVFSIAQAVLITPARNLITLVIIGVIAWQLDPFLAGLSLILSPILGVSAFYFGNRLRHRSRLNREAQSRLMSFVHQTITALPIVQAFGRESANQRKFSTLSNDAVQLAQKNTLLSSSYTLVNGVTMTAGAALVLYAGGQRVISGAVSIGSLLIFVSYLKTLQQEVEALLQTFKTLKSVEASVDRVLDILNADLEVEDRPNARVLPESTTSNAVSVMFEDVSFTYETGNPVLKNITLDVPAGQTIALVGTTGAGKTTLVSLIPRFFDPVSGRVLLNGHDVREIQLASLRRQISVVLQEPFLLPLTVAENIAYGRPQAERDDIIEAASAANADEFIRRLPDGYDTSLSERGVTLSGGQRQRLAIARAMLKDSPILILDEPTSALDTQTEALILQALRRLVNGRTTFMIAHRLSTIREVDRIAVIDSGRIVEVGTHDELITNGEIYAHLHAIQIPKRLGQAGE